MPRPLRTSERNFLLAVSDAAASMAAVLLAMYTWSLTSGLAFSSSFVREQWEWFVAVPVWTVALAPTRHVAVVHASRAVVAGILRATVVLFMLYLAVYFSAGPAPLPRLMAVYACWNAAWLTWAGRVLCLWALSRGAFARRLLVIGDADQIEAVRKLTERIELSGSAIVVARGADFDRPSIEDQALEHGVTDVIVAASRALPSPVVEDLLSCRERDIDVVPFAQLYETALRRVPVRQVSDQWVLTHLFAASGARDASPIAKRIVDLVVATALAILGAVPAACAAVLLLIEGQGSVLYSQTRLGRGGRTFRLTKFRTMRQDAEHQGPQWSPMRDPRITPVGRILRRTHLDELPNLLAVFRGEMSMVGPRPERPEFVTMLEREVPLYRARLSVLPGLTGWAQVNAQYGDSVAGATEKLEYDLYYVQHRSIWFDLDILFRTVGRTLGWRGR